MKVDGLVPRRALRLVEDALADTPVVAINGPRQVGKSTLAAEVLGRHGGVLVSLDDEVQRRAANGDARAFLERPTGGGPLIIDEVQFAPPLFRAMKAAVDRDRRPGRFVVTGSTRLLSAAGVADAFVGRLEVVDLWPLSEGELSEDRSAAETRSDQARLSEDRSAAETRSDQARLSEDRSAAETRSDQARLSEDRSAAETRSDQAQFTRSDGQFVDWAFSGQGPLFQDSFLDRADYAERIVRGGFPEATTRVGRRRSRWFASYLTTLVEKVVKQVSAIERSSEIPRVIRLCAARSGEELNVTRLANDLGLPPRTLDGYLALLAEVFVLQLIPAWSTNVSSKSIRRPKLVMVDSGLASYLTGFTADRIDDVTAPFGPLLESFVAMEIRKQLSWSEREISLSHFRHRDGAEVDLVLEHPDGRIVGLEIKASRTISARDTKGLRFLADRLGDRFHAGFVLSSMPEAVPLGQRITALPIDALWRAPS